MVRVVGPREEVPKQPDEVTPPEEDQPERPEPADEGEGEEDEDMEGDDPVIETEETKEADGAGNGGENVD